MLKRVLRNNSIRFESYVDHQTSFDDQHISLTEQPRMSRRFQFPEGFKWGTATSAYQVEGGLDQLADYGVYASIPLAKGGEYKGGPAGIACDHYARYQQDIELLARLGFDSYRFGVEWARVEPSPNHFDRSALAHYRDVARICREFDIKPAPTLSHFTAPVHVIARGGWEANELPEWFRTYTTKVISELGEYVYGNGGDDAGLITSINEVNTGVVSSTRHGLADERRRQPWAQLSAAQIGVDPDKFTPWRLASSTKAVQTIIEAHRAAVEATKTIDQRLRIGLSVASQNAIPISDDPEFVDFAQKYMELTENRFLRAISNSRPNGGDFVGVQAYVRNFVGRRPDGSIGLLAPAENSPKSALGYEIAPEALELSLRNAHAQTGLPVVATECGVSTPDDDDNLRIQYYQKAIEGVARCIDDRIPVKGFYAWSLLDNYEWLSGYDPKFGLVQVDRDSMIRTPKPSAHWLGGIARSNAITLSNERGTHQDERLDQSLPPLA